MNTTDFRYYTIIPFLAFFLMASQNVKASGTLNNDPTPEHTAKTATKSAEADEINIIALRIYADWCGYCKILDEKLDEVKTDFDDEPVWFTYFDITDEFTIRQTELMAGRLGLLDIFHDYVDNTGTLLLIDPETGEIKNEITHEITKEHLKTSISEHL